MNESAPLLVTAYDTPAERLKSCLEDFKCKGCDGYVFKIAEIKPPDYAVCLVWDWHERTWVVKTWSAARDNWIACMPRDKFERFTHWLPLPPGPKAAPKK